MKCYLMVIYFCLYSFITHSQNITLRVNQPEPPVITQIGDTLKSSYSTNNQWFKDGVEIIGENKPYLILYKSGSYKVIVSHLPACYRASASYNAIRTNTQNIQISDFTGKIFPNPNNGTFTIELESREPENIILELYTSEGKSIIRNEVAHTSYKQQIQFGTTHLPDGVYNLLIKCGRNIQNRRIIVY